MIKQKYYQNIIYINKIFEKIKKIIQKIINLNIKNTNKIKFYINYKN